MVAELVPTGQCFVADSTPHLAVEGAEPLEDAGRRAHDAIFAHEARGVSVCRVRPRGSALRMRRHLALPAADGVGQAQWVQAHRALHLLQENLAVGAWAGPHELLERRHGQAIGHDLRMSPGSG